MSYGSKAWGKWVLEADEALPILKAAWDRGINTIDTANVYSAGASEEIVGRFVREYNIPREEIIIATKCYNLVGKRAQDNLWRDPALGDSRDYVNQHGLSRAAIFNAVDASLRRLGTTYIDLLQIHRFDESVPVEETMRALHDLVRAGKVRYIGASSMRCWQFAMMNEVTERHGWTKFVSMQSEYSLLYREEEREMYPYCRYHGIGLIPWSPLAGGLLARPHGENTLRTETTKGMPWELPVTKEDKEIIARVAQLAERKNATMAQVALAWIEAKVSSPIAGLNSVKRMEDAAAAGGVELNEEEMVFLEELYVPRTVRGHK
ncbi:NADP-dependent oxidoreductase domain-containing protein [Schizophyllum amplum]|uniref:NADP-dependent oxidoreductase domain-containing protein n=1 Tax=Schizophyllum amplum TaxID=97359 RepID=A0A550C5A7_9AGAR|nr:NADP-dependent oxidoreductase domain-containing protein [Auriculariopsis ampla]